MLNGRDFRELSWFLQPGCHHMTLLILCLYALLSRLETSPLLVKFVVNC